jgi:adhesin transport system membrane fusion protein
MKAIFDKVLHFFLPSYRARQAGVTEHDTNYMDARDAAIYHIGHSFAYILSLTIFLLLVAFLFWANQANVDEVTRGMGQVIPSRHVQVIQNLEGGILEKILVAENQIVQKGDILLRINNSIAASQYRDAKNQAIEQEAAIIRLTAEADGKKLNFPKKFDDSPQLKHDQKNIHNARQQQLNSELRVMKAQQSQKQQEIAEMKGRQKQLRKSLAVAQKQLNIAKPLWEQQLYPEVDYLKLEREIITLNGDIEALQLGLPRIQQAAEEAKQRSEQRKAEFRTQALDELNRRRVELKSLQETISAGKDRVTRTDVRSPVRGTINQININTIGGVIRPGEQIMEVVPLDDTLLIEARIRPADIAFLHPGQAAMIKITAYDFSIYGGLEGVVEQISADTIQGEQEDESFYKVKLRTKTNALTYRGAKLPIIPGMTASVDILTGQKTVLDYLLKPILKAKQNALRER